MYNNGNGVLQDTIAAHMWFNIAAANGHKDTAENRDIVAVSCRMSGLKRQRESKTVYGI